MIRYAFDLYPRTDPKDGTRILRFSQLQDAEWRGEANGTGAGRIVLRADSTDAGDIDPEGMQYVRVVRIDTGTVDGATLSGFDEAVVGGFFLEVGDFEALTERSTKRLSFGGAGTLSYLDRAVMWNESFITGGSDPYDDIWRLDDQSFGTWPDADNRLGAMLNRVITEATHADHPYPALPAVTWDFTASADSDGTTWSQSAVEFTAQVGESILLVARRFMEAGLYLDMDPDTFELRAWEQANHGNDLTGLAWGAGVVRFQAPTDGTTDTGNIKSDAKRAIAAHVKRSVILVGGDDVYEAVEDAAADVIWHGSYRAVNEDAFGLEAIGQRQLDARADAGDTVRLRMKLDDDEANGKYLPFEHVIPDDTVTLHTGTGQWDWNETAQKVAALTVKLRPGGDWDAWADLGSRFGAAQSRQFGVGSNVGAHTHPPNPRLCEHSVNILRGLTGSSLKASDDGATFSLPPSNACDGNTGTTWSPDGPAGPTDEHWWAADVGAAKRAEAFRYYLAGGFDDLAYDASIYGATSSAAWSWLPSGKLSADPASNGWTLVGSWSDLSTGDTGIRDLTSPGSYRYWLVRATDGGTGSTNEFDITEFELWQNPRSGDSRQAARCDHWHAAEEIDYDNSTSGTDATNVQDRLDELADPPTVELTGSASTITNDSKHNGFPDATDLPDGRKLLIYRAGTNHVGTLDGKLVGHYGTPGADGTITWGSAFDILDHATLDVREGAVSTIGDRLWIATRTYDGTASGHVSYVLYSDDNAATWSALIPLDGGFSGAEGAGIGKVLLAPDGVTLLVPLHGDNGGDAIVKVLRSTDDFATMSATTIASGAIGSGSNWTEPFILKLDNGEMRCLIREDTDKDIYISRSLSPDGSAWTTPALAFDGYGKPFAFQTYSGAVVVLYRQSSSDRIVFRVSYDRLTSDFGTEANLETTGTTMDYATAVQVGSTIHAIYALKASSTNADIVTRPLADITDVRFAVGRGGSAEASTDVSLDDLTDVDTTGAADGEVLTYDGSDWVAEALPTTSDVFTVDPGTPTYDDATPGEVEVSISSKWGIDSNGDPYFNSAGVTSGEEAALMRDSTTGAYFLRPYSF